MKPVYLFLALCLVPVAACRAQEPSPTPSVSTPAPSGVDQGARRERRQERIKSLTADERTRLKEARRAAIEDPKVKAAKGTRRADARAYRQAMREAMLRKDPSVGEILAKVKGERKKERIF